MVAAGLAIGLAGAVILSRWVQSLLFGVSRFDVPTFIAAAVAVAIVAALAALAPARRALRIDPARALVTEG
jgi:ABC-type antimicrobial peptide transport system permease subunit